MEQKMVALETNDMSLKVEEVRSKVLEQFDLMEKAIGHDFGLMTQHFSNINLRDEFNLRIDELKMLVENGDINPDFKVNINASDDYLALDYSVKVGFFPFAGNPIHWGHLITALDAIIQYKLDKVIFVSNGNDFRKPDLTDVDIRYTIISDAVNLFDPFFEFGDMAKTPLFDSSYPMIGEYALFRFFHMNPITKMTAYYIGGSDHLNRSVIRNGERENDTIGYLEDNIFDNVFEFNPDYHSVVALMNARNVKEYDKKLSEIVNPKVDIVRLNPTVSFSSTQLRNALNGDGHPEALFFLPHVCFEAIVANDWYR